MQPDKTCKTMIVFYNIKWGLDYSTKDAFGVYRIYP